MNLRFGDSSRKEIVSELSNKIDTLVKRPAPKVAAEPHKVRRMSYPRAAGGEELSFILTVEGEPRELPPLRPTVLFYPTIPEGLTSEETQKVVVLVLNPKTDGFKVVRTRKIKGAGVI